MSQPREETLRIEVSPGKSITAIRTPAARNAKWLFIYAPGAGSNMHDPFGTFAARELARHGVETVRFQFLYMEAQRRSPDRTAVLEATWRAVIESAATARRRPVVGGRSMGGRIASHVVAQGVEVDALAMFAYPLHAPARPNDWRDAHLPKIATPAFFCGGTRDAFAAPNELTEVTTRMPNATLHLLEGADHGFAVPKSSGRSRQDVWAEACEAFRGWLDAL